jgi:hypothetical protein
MIPLSGAMSQAGAVTEIIISSTHLVSLHNPT